MLKASLQNVAKTAQHKKAAKNIDNKSKLDTPELDTSAPHVPDTVNITWRTSWHPARCPLYPSVDCRAGRFFSTTQTPSHDKTLTPDKILASMLTTRGRGSNDVNSGDYSRQCCKTMWVRFVGLLLGLMIAFAHDYLFGFFDLLSVHLKEKRQ